MVDMATDAGLPCSPMGRPGNKRMASGGMRYPTGPINNTWADGEPLISFEGKCFVGTGRDPGNLQ